MIFFFLRKKKKKEKSPVKNKEPPVASSLPTNFIIKTVDRELIKVYTILVKHFVLLQPNFSVSVEFRFRNVLRATREKWRHAVMMTSVKRYKWLKKKKGTLFFLYLYKEITYTLLSFDDSIFRDRRQDFSHILNTHKENWRKKKRCRPRTWWSNNRCSKEHRRRRCC